MSINIKVNKDEFNSIVSGLELTCLEVVNTHIKEIQLDNSINNTTATHKSHTIRKEMRKLSERGVFFVNDIITPNGRRALSWNQLNTLTGRNLSRGSPLKAFQVIQEITLDICNLNTHYTNLSRNIGKLNNSELSEAIDITRDTTHNILYTISPLKCISHKQNAMDHIFEYY